VEAAQLILCVFEIRSRLIMVKVGHSIFETVFYYMCIENTIKIIYRGAQRTRTLRGNPILKNKILMKRIYMVFFLFYTLVKYQTAPASLHDLTDL
jgi:hypothetical protein